MRKLSQDFQVVVTFNAIIHTVCYNLTEWAPVSSGAEYMYRGAITSSRQYLDPDLKASSREGQKWEKRQKDIPKASETILSIMWEQIK